MAASAWRIYRNAKKKMMKADMDLNSAALRMKIVKGTKAAAVSNYARVLFSSLTHIAANWKTTHIRSLTGATVTALAGSNTMKFDFDNEIWTASGGNVTSVQYAVIGISNGDALAWCKLTGTAVDITSTNTLTITINASNGAFTLVGGET